MPSATTGSSSRRIFRTATRSSRGRWSHFCDCRSRRRASARSCGTTARRTTGFRPDRERRAAMMTHKLISADSHIVEPPDLYTTRIEPRFRDRAPRLERMETPSGRKFDAWVIDGQQVGTLGAVMQAGQRFEDPSQIDFLGMWEDVRL